jgi:uncharacterized protein (DUF934 family)
MPALEPPAEPALAAGRTGGLAAAAAPQPPARGLGAAAGLSGEADGDGPIWKHGAFRRDPWALAEEGGDPEAPLLVSLARFLAERARLVLRSGPLGLILESGAATEEVAADIERFSLIALSFPKFSDGRSFSTARLLREKYGFRGELRAVGNVLSDQIPFMRRVGFDAFEVAHMPTRRALVEGRIAEVHLYYQPAVAEALLAGARPWLRRRET